ncbi:MAG: DHA1 family tetracycline resistance protein-like MFS transporter [Verrucomicrobiales bacterium]|jgi:DHA1 family tetracycline resistance protein-like MFS transporter
MARKPALGFIFVTLVLDILGLGLIVPILPKLVETMQSGGLSEAAHTYGFLIALYALMQFLFAPLLGSLSDRFGRRPVILVSLLGGGLDYFLLAYAPNLSWFVVGRIIAGITGANYAAAAAYIADVSPPEKRAANFGLIGAAFGLGFIIGPTLGGWLGDINLRLPFIVAGCLTLLNWLFGLFVLPESLGDENRRSFSWKRSNPVGALLDLKRYPMVLGLSWTYFLVSVAHQVFPATWVLYTGYRFGWGPKEIGLSLGFVGVMAALVQGGLTRVIIPKLGEQRAAILGLVISVLSYICYGLASEGWMIYATIVWGSLGGLSTPAVQSLVSRNVGADEQGGVQGALTSLTSVAGILGPPIATGLFGYFISEQAPILLPGAAFFFAGLLVVIAILLAKRSFRSPLKSPVARELPNP